MLNILLLCGGKGTRISGILGSNPKVLAPVAGYPFLDYLLSWISSSFTGIEHRVNLLTGIGHDLVNDYFKELSSTVRLIREPFPLGTLGAVFNALDSLGEGPLLVLNGDTVIDIDLSQPFRDFLSYPGKNLLLVKNFIGSNRYGGYRLVNNSLRKANVAPQFISMGAFFTDKEKLLFIRRRISNPFGQLMLDDDFLDKSPTLPYIINKSIPFIDIGIPKDYELAQTLIPQLISL